MKRRERIVTRLPLTELWEGEQVYPRARCLGVMSREEARRLLDAAPVRLVLADIGHPLQWIPSEEVDCFWKRNSAHIASDPDHLDIEADGWLLLAERWHVPDLEPVVLVLRMFH